MRRIHWLIITGIVACIGGSFVCLAQDQAPKKKRILMYSASFGFRHSVVARPLTGELSHAEKIFKEIATKAGYDVAITQDHNELNNERALKRFDAIVLYTTGTPPIDQKGLLKWVKEGGALIGIHSATDSFYDWPEYGKLMGAYFKTHGGNNVKAAMKIEDPEHPSTKMLPADWAIADEIYQFRDESFSRDNVHMLISIDTKRMSDSDLKTHKFEKDKYYPVAWTNTLEKGRVFYSSLGHREDVWTNELYQKHVLGGIAWALKQDQKK